MLIARPVLREAAGSIGRWIARWGPGQAGTLVRRLAGRRCRSRRVRCGCDAVREPLAGFGFAVTVAVTVYLDAAFADCLQGGAAAGGDDLGGQARGGFPVPDGRERDAAGRGDRGGPRGSPRCRRLFHVRYTLRGTSYLLHRIGFTPQVPIHRAVLLLGPAHIQDALGNLPAGPGRLRQVALGDVVLALPFATSLCR
jgi:hypothetical protein